MTCVWLKLCLPFDLNGTPKSRISATGNWTICRVFSIKMGGHNNYN